MADAVNRRDEIKDILWGGRNAVLGFYYQLIAAVGIPIIKHETLTEESDALTVLTAFTADGAPVSLPEYDGEDLVIANGEHRMLCQFKHSSDPEEYAIEPAHLKKAVTKGFVISLRQFRERDGDENAVTGCLLITNRDLGPSAAAIARLCKACRQALLSDPLAVTVFPKDLSPCSECRVDYPGKAGGLSIENLVEEWGSDDEDLKSDLRLLLPRLHVLPQSATCMWTDPLAALGDEYGATDFEREDATNRLVGDLMARIDRDPVVTKERIVAALTGRPGAKPLTVRDLAAPCAEALNEWSDGAYLPASELVIPRGTTNFYKASDKPIVVITGGGGCGKTQFLGEVLGQIVRRAGGTESDGLVMAVSARRLGDNWIAEELGRWGVRDGPLKDWARRLRRANPGKPIVLWACIDGVDEGPSDAARTVARLAADLRRERGFKLVLTCRESEYERIINNCLSDNASGWMSKPEDVGQVIIGDFSREELTEAAAQVFGTQADLYLNPELVVPGYGDMPKGSPSALLLDSLYHPRMFGAFCHVCGTDFDLFRAALQEDGRLLDRISEAFLGAFYLKLEHHNSHEGQYFIRDCKDILRQIARMTNNQEGPWRPTDWRDWASQMSIDYLRPARHLYDEAAAAGLIQAEAATGLWKWRHAFVAAFLAMAGGEV